MRMRQDFFSGEHPRLADHLIQMHEAQIAQNCDLSDGSLRAMKRYEKVANITESGTLKSLYFWKTDTDVHRVVSTYDLDFVRSSISGEANSRVYVSGLANARVLSKHLVSKNFNFTTASYKLGVPAPVDDVAASGYETGSIYRAYFYTYVVGLGPIDGEEGKPSPVTEISYGSGDVSLTGFSEPPVDRSIAKIRIYRTNSGSSGLGEFYYMGEFDTNSIVDWAAYTFVDNIPDSDLNEVCPSVSWDMPPDNIKGFVSLVNGSIAGFVGNTVYLSEPYLPHAWPYAYSIDARIVGLGVIGTSVVVMSDEGIYLLSGQPEAMSTLKFAGRFSCESKRGIVTYEKGVLFPSPEGPVLVDENGPFLSEYEFFEKGQWKADYYPKTITAVFFQGHYINFNVVGSFAIDTRDKNLRRIMDPVPIDAACVSLVDNELYFIAEDDDGSNALYKWEGSPVDYLRYTYRSKAFKLPYYTNFTIARVLYDTEFHSDLADLIVQNAANAVANAAAIAAGLEQETLGDQEIDKHELNYDELAKVYNLSATTAITFNLYAEGTLVFTKTVTSVTEFRLPEKALYKHCFYEIIGYVPILEVAMATSPEELDGD